MHEENEEYEREIEGEGKNDSKWIYIQNFLRID